MKLRGEPGARPGAALATVPRTALGPMPGAAREMTLRETPGPAFGAARGPAPAAEAPAAPAGARDGASRPQARPGPRIVACVKQSIDTSFPLVVAGGVVRQAIGRPAAQLGPADRAALDLALGLAERLGGELAAISVGEAEALAALRYCLARGAAQATQLRAADRLDPLAAAAAVARWLGRAPAALLLCGRASADGGSGLFPAALAQALEWPLVSAAVAVVPDAPGWLRVERRIDRGDREIVRCPLPAVVAVEPSLEEPRYVGFLTRRRAERRPIELLEADGAPAAGAPESEPGEASGSREDMDVASGAGTRRPVDPCAVELLAIEPARPRPRRGSTPDAKASAMDRLGHLLGGGAQKKRSGGLVEGSPASVATEIVAFLEEKGLLAPRSGHGHG